MSDSVGAALKAAREARQLTLAQVAETTRVRPHYLQALENDDISAIPSSAQARGFLKLYAEFLGLDLSTLIPPPAAAAPAAAPGAANASSSPSASEPSTAGQNLFTRLRERLASLTTRKANADVASSTPSPASAEPEVDADDKKKAPS
jgi:transcriptional regulator with XRE-family HTH domain